jgi:iron complex outermembrane receptor protein
MSSPLHTISAAIKSRAPLVLGASMLVALSVSQAIAADDDKNALEEVVVTAQFREQNVQQTPIAITAINAAMLEARNQTDISQVAAQAPNVTLQSNGAAFGSSMVAFIRGVGQTDFNLALEPGVGIYVDDVYYPTLTGSLLDLLDVERVEVLRGPQGTLAGKNSIGGAVKMYSKKPTGGDTGYIEVTGGKYNRIDVRGAADFSLVPDKLFVRASLASKHHDGYVTRLDYACANPGTNVPSHAVGDGCVLGHDGGQAFNAARVAFRWLASDAAEINLAIDGTNDQSGVTANTLLKVNPVSFGGLTYTIGTDGNPVFFGPQFIPKDPYTSYGTYTSNARSAFPPFSTPSPYLPITVPAINHYKSWGVSGDAKIKLTDNLELTSISAYREYTNQFAEQTDSSPIGVQILLERQSHHKFTQELRLGGKVGEGVDYTLGAFYLDQNGFLNARVGLPWVAFDFIHGRDFTPSRTYAGFANVAFKPVDSLTVDAGLRYSDEKKDYTFQRHNADGSVIIPGGFNNAVAATNGLSAHFKGNRLDYRVAANYQFTPDVMGYVQTATGYKGGGVDPRPFYPEQAVDFGPEKLTAYEVGLKTSLMDRRLRLNSAVFFNKYKDIQLTLNPCPGFGGSNAPDFDNGSPCAMPANVGAADVKGAELEIEAHPVDGLMIDGSFSLLDFKYTETNTPLTSIKPGMITPYTPKKKGSLGVQYEIPLTSGGSVTPRVDVAYQSAIFAAAVNDPLVNRIPGRTTANARITWRDTDGAWSAALQVNNLTDKLYYTTLFGTLGFGSAGYVNGTPAMPRTWAVTIKRNFK